jgi:prefoldin subunit 5
LNSGGGGGTLDGMEARVAKLESAVEFIQRDVAELKADIKEMRETSLQSARPISASFSEPSFRSL